MHDPAGALSVYLYNSYIEVNTSSTGVTHCLSIDGASTWNSYGCTYKSTNTDNDGIWAYVTAGDTLNSYGDVIITGALANAGTANIYSTTTEGDLYVYDNCSALSFTDRTPTFEGNALEEIRKIKSKDGKIDHETLPEFVKVKKQGRPIIEKQIIDGEEKEIIVGYEEEIERNIGNMISVNTKAIQELLNRIEILEKKL